MAGQQPRAVTLPQRAPGRPVHRHGLSPHVINGRADRKYIIAYPGFFGPDYYASLGYTRVEKEEGGPDFHFGSAGGASGAVEFHGGVLMQCDVGLHEQRTQYGDFGGEGQEALDELEEQMINKQGVVDPSRNIRRHHHHIPIELDDHGVREKSIASKVTSEEVGEYADY